MTATKSWQEHDLLSWLGREAPRYTSYPSAHHFTPLAPDTYACWLGRLRPEDSVSLYVHVPFCEQMCWFCGCNTQITRRLEPVEAYVDNLVAEIGLVARVLGFRPRAHALHFGGGSPGILPPETMTRLFAALHDAFDLSPGAEISIELDPRRVTSDKAQAWADLGFNRVSLGVQDTQAEVQAAINRIQPMDMIVQSIDRLRVKGLTRLGIDLVYGLPHQTADSLEATLADVARLDPDRISAFSYAHVPWARKHQRLIDETALPDIGEKALQFVQIDTHLAALGYTAIGIDHFAKSDDGLTRALKAGTLRRNFMGYTDLPSDRLIALGASSISELDDGIAQNIPQATSYATHIVAGQLPTVRGWTFSGDDRVRREIIANLMCYFRADVGAIAQKHGLEPSAFDAELENLAPIASAGLVDVNDRVVMFGAPLRMLVRSVACVFDRYARCEGGRYSRVA